MALKAGYKGVKNSLMYFIESLVGSKVIKSIGDGLSLSEAGELEVDIGDGLDIDESDKLAVKLGSGLSFDSDGAIESDSTGGIGYSTTEFDTGNKWIDGKTIYGRVFTGLTISNNTFSTDIDLGVEADTIVDISPGEGTSSSLVVINNCLYHKIEYSSGNNTHIYSACSVALITDAKLVILYTKAATN